LDNHSKPGVDETSNRIGGLRDSVFTLESFLDNTDRQFRIGHGRKSFVSVKGLTDAVRIAAGNFGFASLFLLVFFECGVNRCGSSSDLELIAATVVD
jgi:hypothetical protein